ncbi:MAG: acyl carrier protein [Deltaproteobacteria bacterium]|nr:acyl carrier protein [Deltaproteobacteria bacterium]
MGLLDRIKTMFGSGDAAPPSVDSPPKARKPAGSLGDIERALQEQVARSSQGEFSADSIPSDAPLFDEAYIESVSSVELVSFIEETYGVRIEEVALVGDLASVDALAKHIFAQCQTGHEAKAADQ